jgi:hypothetical protein
VGLGLLASSLPVAVAACSTETTTSALLHLVQLLKNGKKWVMWQN